jgi:hypothetical protein
MATNELPTIAGSAHTHSTYQLGGIGSLGAGMGAQNVFTGTTTATPFTNTMATQAQVARVAKQILADVPKQEQPMSQRRLVQVFIVDPNENIPLADCLLYRGSEQLTDLNDQELYFEIDVKRLLAEHNERRVKIVDRKVKERTEYLEPAKVRDLKMVVTTIATF